MMFDTFPLMLLSMCDWQKDHPHINIVPFAGSSNLLVGYTSADVGCKATWMVRIELMKNQCHEIMETNGRLAQLSTRKQRLDPEFIDIIHRHVNECDVCLPAHVLSQ